MTDSLRLTLLVDRDGSGAPNHGDDIAFVVHTTASKPLVCLRAFQDGALVLTADLAYFAGTIQPDHAVLSSASYTGGASHATATLYDIVTNSAGKTRLSKPLAEIAFEVGA